MRTISGMIMAVLVVISGEGLTEPGEAFGGPQQRERRLRSDKEPEASQRLQLGPSAKGQRAPTRR